MSGLNGIGSSLYLPGRSVDEVRKRAVALVGAWTGGDGSLDGREAEGANGG
jgi:hypothetical protein